jgi:hypothetical protein
MEIVVPYADPAKPRIAYQNLLMLGTVTASSEATGFLHENAYDMNEATFWQPTAGGAAWLQVQLAVPMWANYLALHATTLADNAGSYDLQYSLDGGSTWVSALGVAISPTVNLDPLGVSEGMPVQYRVFTPVLASLWRFWIDSAAASYVGVVSFGQDFECERGCWTGFTPPTMGRQTVVTNSQTVAGKFIGRSVISRNIASKLELEHLTEGWIRGTWMPFYRWAERFPFFLLWNDANWPYEATFCWSNSTMIPAPVNTDAGDIRYMSASISFDGNAEA